MRALTALARAHVLRQNVAERANGTMAQAALEAAGSVLLCGVASGGCCGRAGYDRRSRAALPGTRTGYCRAVSPGGDLLRGRPMGSRPEIEQNRRSFPSAVYRRRGLASLASGEVMSANETASEVRTSITLGTRAPSAS